MMENVQGEYRDYISILEEELIPAGGCTEPIAIAYAAAAARDHLGKKPDQITVRASGNLIKNAKAVYIPNGGDLRGVDAAAVLGALTGHAERKLEILLDVSDTIREEARKLLSSNMCTVQLLDSEDPLHLVITMSAENDSVTVELKGTHTNIVRIEKNGETVYRAVSAGGNDPDRITDHGFLSVKNIVEFANTCDLEDVREIIERQVTYNMAIAEEGLRHSWGVNVGKLYFQRGKILQAYAAAGSDARMSGCEMPVVIVSGSGNQGITASVPVVIYAQGRDVSHERLLRALVLSNLITIHLKTGIGRLSAYCGAVCAATGAGCAMTYLNGGSIQQIEETIINSVATASGIVCDGAKPSCAAKIAASLESAIMAHELAMSNKVFKSGEGIVGTDVEDTISAIGRVATEGMSVTDKVILDLMTQNKPEE